MSQAPNAEIVDNALAYAVRMCGPERAEQIAAGLLDDWTASLDEGPRLAGVMCAGWQLVRALNARNSGWITVAAIHDRIAEACVQAWRDELTVRTTSVEDAPTTDGPGTLGP